MLRSAAALLALVPALALAGERTILLKTFEIPLTAPVVEYCQRQGFDPLNIVLSARAWSFRTNAARGEVMNETVRFLGDVIGCGSMDVPTKEYAPEQFFLIRFDLEDGRYVARGECDLVSQTVPVPGLLLVGCALRLVEMPEGVRGGFATSATIFNPFKVQGFDTGSVWTLHLYTAD